MELITMLWKVKAALRIAIQRFRNPLIFVHSSGWNNDDHQHICFAAHILAEDDFKEICPVAKNKNACIEYEDECDFCPYLGIIDFDTDKTTGKKLVRFNIGP